MISFAQRFVFIAVPKCGTTAIEEMLEPHIPTRLAGPPAIKHAGLRDFDRHLRPFLAEKGFRTFTTIGAVRDPIDWLMSWWRYRGRDENKDKPKYTGGVGFDEFAEAYLSADPPPFARLRNRHPSELLVHDGRTVDELFRYENLERMIQWLSERLGVALQPAQRNVSPAPRVEVSEALASRLRQALADDYELWSAAR